MEDITVGQSILDLDTPVLLLDLDLFEKNVKRMADYCAAAGVSWRPHAKGQKVPALVHKEIAAGAIGCTVAKLGEAEVMAAAGITDGMLRIAVGIEEIGDLVDDLRAGLDRARRS